MTAAIELDNLRYRYADGAVALDGISLQVAPGESVGLIGPNGAGKSTLLQHLNGILPERLATSPAVTIFGVPVNEKNLATIRRSVGLLFQDPDDQLFCPTVYEDVAFGPQQFGLDDGTLAARVAAALESMNLHGLAERSPYHLSEGEKRRVCLAGVLACEPRVLALDEPTNNLDPRGKRELKQLLRQITATKIIATHDLELVAELCHRLVVLDHGLIVADGPSLALLDDEPLMLAHGLERPHILRHLHPH